MKESPHLNEKRGIESREDVANAKDLKIKRRFQDVLADFFCYSLNIALCHNHPKGEFCPLCLRTADVIFCMVIKVAYET